MARDRQLPSFLAKVHKTHKVPVNATLLVAAVSLLLGLYMATRDDGISLLSTLVNFGAMSAFLVLHVSVINYFIRRRHSKDYLRHLVFPLIGFAILAFVVVNAKVAAQVLAFLWIAVGVVVLLVFRVLHKEPELSALEEE
jgi:amino acid transporter